MRRQILRSLLTLLLLGLATGHAAAQVPSHFGDVEAARSRDCVPVLARLGDLDQRLAPLARTSQRLIAIAQAIALEDRSVVDSLHVSDPVEKQVHDWFARDSELAQQYVASPSQALLDQRSAGRDAIKQVVSRALDSVQTQADSTIDATGDLRAQVGSCSGAVFLRPVVLQACATSGPSPVCEAARDTATKNGPFRFVDTPDELWGIQEFRAWSAPSPLQVDANGQLAGARTTGLTRNGNVVVSVTFRPLLRRRTDMTDAEAERARVLTDSLGFGASHPDFVFVPALAIQASLPSALDDETRYILHFGEPESAEIVWAAKANTGSNLDGVVALTMPQVRRLQAGDPLSLTALRANDDGTNEAVFSLELTSLNQVKSVSALLGYMAQQLPDDLAQLLPPDSTSTTSN